MSKGTPSFGKHQSTTHMRCRRCGRYTYHKARSTCAACGFGKTASMKTYGWKNKDIQGRRKW
ncbi:MAG: 50S ribosomal protein L37e [Candidatus Aenigmatarchaeota archaeon]|nr:MAG: 50S ribosomal protein L37e [Candidatus Aenigmarchaeota archaeon]